MRWSNCWSCVMALAFLDLWVDAAEDTDQPGKSKKGYSERPNEWPRIFEQARLGTMIVKSSTTICHPKITPAPILMKRKLGSNKWDLVHEGIQGQKRDAASCPTDYHLCPESMKGGCCPSDRVCGTSSCFTTSAGPASACGMLGYIACGIDDGGGCCPSDYVCGRAGCTPSVGVSNTQTCGVNSYLCPASLGYGCCKNGMGCGLSNCYSTDIVTVTLVETTTTTDAGVAQTLISTIVTAITPQAPTVLASTGVPGAIPKATSPAEAAITKTNATQTSSGGLTKPQLGGIIGGAILLLIILILATFLIIRRLNKLKVIVEASRRSSSGPRSRNSRPNPVVTRDIDTMSIDPLMVVASPSEVSRTYRHGSHPSLPGSAIHSLHHEVEASTPPFFHSPWSPRSPPFNNFGSGYTPIATSESSILAGYRHHSLESTPGTFPSPVGYFDIPTQGDLRDQNLRFGHTPARRPSRHERQWSESSGRSELSHLSDTSSGMAELDAGPDGDRRSSFQKALQGFGMGRLLSRRKSSAPSLSTSRKQSDPLILTGGPAGRPDWAVAPVALLGHIPEAGESRLEVQEIPGGGLTNSAFREMTMEQQAYARKEYQERQYAMNPAGQGTELLRDVDLRN